MLLLFGVILIHSDDDCVHERRKYMTAVEKCDDKIFFYVSLVQHTKPGESFHSTGAIKNLVSYELIDLMGKRR